MSYSTSGQYDSALLRLLFFQLQLEIALLQGELQTERKQLHRRTQRLQALQQETRKTDKNRQKVSWNKINLKLLFLIGLPTHLWCFMP